MIQAAWLTANIDVVLFIHCTAMLLLAGIFYSPGKVFAFARPEFNLQLFALGITLCVWFDMALYLFPGVDILLFPGMVIFFLSFLALMFYSVSFLSFKLKKIVIVYALSALFFAVYSSLTSGPRWGYSSLYNTLAFPASLAAAYTFSLNAFRLSGNRRAGWLISAVSMLAYSLTWLLSTPFEHCDTIITSGAETPFYTCFVSAVKAIAAAGILAGIYVMKINPEGSRRYKQESFLFPVLISLVLLLSSLTASWRGDLSGHSVENEILGHSRSVANAISPEMVTRLKFSPDDKNNPDFMMVRSQMISYGRYAGLNSIYSFTMINGRLVFGPENIDEKSPMASSPGTVYLEPDPSFVKVFSNPVPGIIGPYKDEYGTFVSGYAPVLDPRTGRVLMVVCIDVSAEKWRSAVSFTRFTVFILTFVLIGGLMLMEFLLVMRREVWKDSASPFLRQLETFYILVAGIIISILVFILTDDYEKRRYDSDFATLSDSVAGVVRGNIVNLNYDLETLAKYFESSVRVDSEEFRIFTSEMRFGPIKERAWYRAVYGTDGASSYPLMYIESSGGSAAEPGFDLNSTPQGRNAILKSLSATTASFVEYRNPGGDKPRGKLMMVIRPVFKDRAEVEGMVSNTADMDLLLRYSMSFSKGRSGELGAEIIDITALDSEESLSVYLVDGGTEKTERAFRQAVYPVFIFGRVLGIRIFISGEMRSLHSGNMGLLGGASALMLTFAISVLSAFLKRRESSLEELVKGRTRELSESEERFRTLHEASFGGISVHDGGVIIECNEGLARMTGYSLDELTGMNGLLLIEPAWRDFVLDKIRSGWQETYDVEGVRKNGEVYPLEITGKNIPYHGKAVRVTEFRDITERKRNEELLKNQREELEARNEELHAEMEQFEAINAELIDANHQLIESEEKFSKAFSINPAVMVLSSIDEGRLYEVNEAFLQTFGYSRDEVIGKTVFELNLYADPAQRDLALDFIRRDGIVRNLEVELKTSTGESRFGLFSADYIVINDKKYMLTVLTDITERKVMEQSLRENETKYRMLFETAVDGIMIMENYRFIDCNTKAVNMFGCTRDYIIGKTPDCLSPEFQPDGAASRDKAMKIINDAYTGSPQFFEWTHSMIDGSTFEAEVSLNTFSISGRRYMIAIVRDITDRKKIEMRLSHMQKMDAIGQLAGGIAHDFNNQLSGILGYAEILSMKLNESNLRKYSDGIISAAMRSADLTKKLLAFARKGQFQLVPVDIHLLIDETIEILKHSIDRRISIVKNCNALSAVVYGDPAQLQNALLNLGLNARDAMNDGGTLTFETGIAYIGSEQHKMQIMEVSEGQYLSVRVTDTGSGMSDEVKSHLFEPFFTTKESGKGTGMGLASVYGTVKNHNGTISVYSEQGHGTSIRVYLPLADEKTDDLQRSGTEDYPYVPPQRILVIDDEEIVRGVLTEILNDMGHIVTGASNGAEGVSIYREKWREIDVVIIDMIMPEMNGRDAFQAMKLINPGIKAVLSSGFSMDIESQLLLSEGVRGFIHKPYRKNDLIKTISDVVTEKK